MLAPHIPHAAAAPGCAQSCQLSVTSPLSATAAALPQSHLGLPAQSARVVHLGAAPFTATLVNVICDGKRVAFN